MDNIIEYEYCQFCRNWLIDDNSTNVVTMNSIDGLLEFKVCDKCKDVDCTPVLGTLHIQVMSLDKKEWEKAFSYKRITNKKRQDLIHMLDQLDETDNDNNQGSEYKYSKLAEIIDAIQPTGNRCTYYTKKSNLHYRSFYSESWIRQFASITMLPSVYAYRRMIEFIDNDKVLSLFSLSGLNSRILKSFGIDVKSYTSTYQCYKDKDNNKVVVNTKDIIIYNNKGDKNVLKESDDIHKFFDENIDNKFEYTEVKYITDYKEEENIDRNVFLINDNSPVGFPENVNKIIRLMNLPRDINGLIGKDMNKVAEEFKCKIDEIINEDMGEKLEKLNNEWKLLEEIPIANWYGESYTCNLYQRK